MTALYSALATEIDTQPLIQVSAWALGEFQEEPNDSPEIMVRLLSMPQTSVDTKCYLITAVTKLAVRFGLIEPAKETLRQFAKDNDLEIQQRSGELLRVLEKTALYDEILAPIEVDEPETKTVEPGAPHEAGPAAAVGGDDLLDLGDDLIVADDVPAPPKPLAAGLPSEVGPETRRPEEKPVEAPPGSVEALRTSDYVVFFEIQRNAQNPRQLAIRPSVFNLLGPGAGKFLIQYGVPQGCVSAAQSPSSMVLEAKGGKPIRQAMMLENRGVAPLRMLTQTTYMYRTQPIKEMGEINPVFG